MIFKKRYYIRCVKEYLHLFKGQKDNFFSAVQKGGLSEPYLYNANMIEDGDPFFRGESQVEEAK